MTKKFDKIRIKIVDVGVFMKLSIIELENSSEKKKDFEIDETFDIDGTCTRAKGFVVAKVTSDIVKIEGEIEANAILECARCLKKKDVKFCFEISEVYCFNKLVDDYPEELEIKDGNFIEDLEGKKEIDLTDLIYQNVTINFPNKYVCDINCKGEDDIFEKYIHKSSNDPRLEVFKNIRIKEKEG